MKSEKTGQMIRTTMGIRRKIEMVFALQFLLLFACGKSSVQPQPNPPVQQTVAAARHLRIQQNPSSGNYDSFFIRLKATAVSADFIEQNLVNDLPIAGAPNPEYHVTLMILNAVTGQSLSVRQNAIEQVKTRLVQELESLPRNVIEFEIQGPHSFPGNTRFIVLEPTPNPGQIIRQLHGVVYQNIDSSITQLGLNGVLTIQPNLTLTQYHPHMSVFKTVFGAPAIHPGLFGTMVNTIQQRIDSLRSSRQLLTLELNSIVLSD